VTIDFQSFLMPAAAGIKVMELMQQALACERRFARADRYTPTEAPRLELVMVRADEVQPRTVEPAARQAPAAHGLTPAQLEHSA
jgi:hypothetical protein